MKLRTVVPSLVLVLAACGGGGGGGGGSIDVTAKGRAFKGPVAGAAVAVRALRDTGAVGELLKSGTSGADGAFEIGLSGASRLALVCVTGGTFEDEASGAPSTIPADQPLCGIVRLEEMAVEHAVTPLNTIAFRRMQVLAYDPEATLDDSAANAERAVGLAFGVPDIVFTIPADLTAGPVAPGPEAEYGAVLAGISRLALEAGVGPLALVTALATDGRDGRFDGLDFGAPVPLGAGTLPAGAGTGDLAAAVASFLASPENQSGLTPADVAADEVLSASSGILAKPIQVRALADGHGRTDAVVTARVEAMLVPPNPQVLIESQLLLVTDQTATTLAFEIPTGLALGAHDLVLRDGDTGLVTRLREAIEVFDPGAGPSVAALSPPAGPLTGGSFLEIRGAGLGPTPEVRIDGVVAKVLLQDLPGRLVVATPPHAAGPVGVNVSNGFGEVFLSDAFEYRADDTRGSAPNPPDTQPLVFGAFRLFADETDGLTVQALSGTSTLNSSSSGSFNLTELSATELVPGVAERVRSGPTFQALESLGRALLFSDSVNARSDFLRVYTNEENAVSVGATAFGPACVFPRPTALRVGDVAGRYWVNGIEVDLNVGRMRQRTGWLELDDQRGGSANFLVHGRDFAGTAATLAHETWTVEYVLTSDGALFGLRTTEGASQSFQGRLSTGAALGFFVENRADEAVAFHWMMPVAHGLESAAWGGWTGGSLRAETVSDGMGGSESAFASGSYRGLVAGPALDSTRLSFERETFLSQSKPVGVFSENVGAAELDVSPSGRLFQGDDVVGYVGGGFLLSLGQFPNECLLDAGVGLPMGSGVATFRHARKSFLSLEPDLTQVAIEARFLESSPSNAQELGTDVFDLTLDPLANPVLDGVTLPLAGTIPALAAGALTGFHKSTVRASNGGVATKRVEPPPWAVTVGYSVIDDQLDLFATEITQPGGRFVGAGMPRWVASGRLGNDGELAVLRSSDEFLGDGLLFLVARRGVDVALPSLPMDALGLGFDPGAGGFSSVTASRTGLQFDGLGAVANVRTSLSLGENGAFSTAADSGLGAHTTPVGQRLRVEVPGLLATREWETVWTPSGDAFIGIDDSPSLDTVEILLGILPAVTGSFADDDHELLGLELDPVASRATTQQLLLNPRGGPLLTGEILTSRRDAGGHVLLPAQSFVSTQVIDLGLGLARVPLIGQTPVLRFLFNQREESAGQGDLTIFVTPRILRGLDD